MSHQYQIGNKVSLSFGFYNHSGSGIYAITRLLPTRIDGEPQYRIKGEDDVERVIGENQIVGSGTAKARARSPHNPITDMFDRLLDRDK